MRRGWLSLALLLAVAALAHVTSLWAAPRLIMREVFSEAAKLAGTNAFAHLALATAESRTIVRPSPDLAYSFCVLDLASGPVRLEVPLTAPYTSVALFGPTSDNYYARNDLDTDGAPLDVIVVAPGEPRPGALPERADVVEAPSKVGLALVRRVVARPEDFAELDAVRRTARCTLYRD